MNKRSSANTCVTTCGHKYCMGCFIKCIQANNNCAICRKELYVKEDEDEDDEDEEITLVSEEGDDDGDDGYEDDYDDEDDEDDDDTTVTLEMMMYRLQNEGISYKDLLRNIYWHNKSDMSEYNGNRNKMKIRNKMNTIVTDIYREVKETKEMEIEDLNSKYTEIQTTSVTGIAGMADVITREVVNILVPRRRMR